MPYVTSGERRAEQRGKAEGKVEGQAVMLLRVLEQRFRVAVPEEVVVRIRAATEAAALEQWLAWVFETSSMEEFQQRMQS